MTGLYHAGETVNLFVLDAHYEPAQLGTVFLIGKVRRGSDYESACIAVSNIKQTLFFVPKPFVFQDSDGDLAKCARLRLSNHTCKAALESIAHQIFCNEFCNVETLVDLYQTQKDPRRLLFPL
jgi:hypothetical protein